MVFHDQSIHIFELFKHYYNSKVPVSIKEINKVCLFETKV